MGFEHVVEVPLALPEARRLLAEVERRLPQLPGLTVRIDLAFVDASTTSVAVRADLAAPRGPGSALLLETGIRLLRRYADSIVTQARERATAQGDGVRRDRAPRAEQPVSSPTPGLTLKQRAAVAATAGAVFLTVRRRRRRRRARRNAG